jgi:hypothetical protein
VGQLHTSQGIYSPVMNLNSILSGQYVFGFPDPDLLVRGTDPAPDQDPSIIKQKLVRKTLIFTVL